MHISRSRNAILILASVIFLLLFVVAILFGFWFGEYSREEAGDYLHMEEVVEVPVHDEISSTTVPQTETLPIEPVLFEYVEVVNSCGPHFEGECVNARSGPGTDFDALRQLRTGVVLKVGGVVERDGQEWYRIVFDEWLRYPERLRGDWYIRADLVNILYDEGDKTVWDNGDEVATTSKRIIVDRTKQLLFAYEDGDLFMMTPISTGLELTPTPEGIFTIFKKTPSRYMQGPLPGLVDQQIYDLPGVPWNLYFTIDGAVIHGAYWHNSFGSKYSHGCVNLPMESARILYNWAELGMSVQIRD